MNKIHKKKYERILSIYPTHRGYSFAVLEGPHQLIDWGSEAIKNHKNARSLSNIRLQIEVYEVDAVVIEDHAHQDTRRGQRIKNLLEAIEVLGSEIGIAVYTYSRSDVRTVFEMFGATKKEEIASCIYSNSVTNELPTPPVRKPWMSETRRMAIYDAISFGMTHYYLIT